MKLEKCACVMLAVLTVAGCSSKSGGSPGSGGTPGTGGAGTGGAGTGGAGTGGAGTGGAGPGGAAAASGGAGGTVVATCGPFANGGGPGGAGGGTPSATMTFFVSSDKNMTGNLNGLAGADLRCQTLAAAVGLGANKVWHAYLSVEHDPANGNNPTNAKDRIGAGPWFNANGVMLAQNVAALHSRTGDPTVFIDEHRNMVNGQWTGSMTPNEHDILTGTNADGTVAMGKTCSDWTSAASAPDGGVPDAGTVGVARVGHTDGFGGGCSVLTTPNNLTSWNSAHDNAGCDNTAPRGGAGRIYCFAIN